MGVSVRCCVKGEPTDSGPTFNTAFNSHDHRLLSEPPATSKHNKPSTLNPIDPKPEPLNPKP